MGKKAAIPENVDDDDALDMFADNLDGDAKKMEETKAPTKEKEDPILDEVSKTRIWQILICNCHTKVSWEFKWKTDDAELHGPHTSQKMLDWQVGNLLFGFVSIFSSSQESGFFDAGILVRKVGTEEFRDSKRIDFELYV